MTRVYFNEVISKNTCLDEENEKIVQDYMKKNNCSLKEAVKYLWDEGEIIFDFINAAETNSDIEICEAYEE